MKRFYKMVTCPPVAGGYEIHLDGKPVKMPSGRILCLPGKLLAEAVMQEWAAQTGDIMPENMPLTQLATTTLDRVNQERPAMEQAALSYLDTDLLCYRTMQPAAVAERQAQAWDPWLAWFKEHYGVELQTTHALRALRQPEEGRQAVISAMKALDNWQFTVLQLVTALSGSLVLGLAFFVGAATPDEVFAVMHVEEGYKAGIYNEQKHGFAPHVEKQRASVSRDLESSRRFLNLLKASS
jgi:chaperone required for assembly of F1-ATPase